MFYLCLNFVSDISPKRPPREENAIVAYIKNTEL